MAPTLTASADITNWAINLTVTGAVGAITVTRYVQGVSPTGQAVRGSFANDRVVPDRDAPLNTDLVYIASDSTGQSPQIPARLDGGDAVLNVMSDPTLTAVVTVLADVDQRYTGRTTAHPILGTNAVLATVEKPSYRAGMYRFLVPTVDEWQTLLAIIATGAVMLLRSPCQTEYADTSFIMTDTLKTLPWNRAAPRHRIVEMSYQSTSPDTARPRDYAWAWGDVPGRFASWGDVPLAVATWGDLASMLPPAGTVLATPEIGL